MVGDVTIVALRDALIERYPTPLAELFPDATDEQWSVYRDRYPQVFSGDGAWRVDVLCYVVRTPGAVTLVDTGIGPAGAPYATHLGLSGSLLDALRAVGYTPDAVDLVLMTHLHPDHIGWNVDETGGGPRLLFSRARHVVHRRDWDAWTTPEVEAAFPFPFVDRLVLPMKDSVELIEGPEVQITDEISAILTPGHTPGSVSFLVASQGERAVIWGDVFVHPALVSEPAWDFAFEMDRALARDTRERLLQRIERDGMNVAACHMPFPGFGRIARAEGRRWWQAI